MDVNSVGPFLREAGLMIDSVTAGRVTGRLDVGERQRTPWGVVHGGSYTTAVESEASVGASAAVADRGQVAVGIHNATDFVRSVTGQRLTVVAEAVQLGRIQQLWEVATRDSTGRLVARGTVRLQNIDKVRRPTQ